MLPATDLLMTPSDAKSEKKLRMKARRNFLAYCQYVDPRYEAQPHVRLLASKLQQVALYIASGGKQGIGRLMIFMPPQHGKSQLASRHFPAWLLGLLPDSRIILTSYGESLATTHSRYIRDQVTSDEYQAVFGSKSDKIWPVELSSDSRSTEAWDLAKPYRGGVKAAGVGGGITGLPAHLFIIDDPFKNREEAESEGRRDLVDDWFKSAARTRLRPNAAVVIFHTRWHQDDLAGRLMQRMVSDPLTSQYEIVCMPALALEKYPTEEEQRKMMREGVFLPLADPLGRSGGAALCPEWYDEAWLASTKADVGLYDFEALYQQSPYAREGNMFKREWFTKVSQGPGNNVWVRMRAWDKAGTPGGGARTAGIKMSWGKDDFIYVEHAWKGQIGSAERDKKMVEIGKVDYQIDGPFLIWHPQDPGSAGLDSAQSTNALLAENGLIGTFDQVTGDKVTNAGPFATMAEAGRVRLVEGEWNDEYLDELSAFPKGRFKDQVDGSGSGFNKMRGIVELLKNEDDEEFVFEERVSISPV
ncbi:MAG: terminase large subunit domain-containing protein [Chloroflexota bacterium]